MSACGLVVCCLFWRHESDCCMLLSLRAGRLWAMSGAKQDLVWAKAGGRRSGFCYTSATVHAAIAFVDILSYCTARCCFLFYFRLLSTDVWTPYIAFSNLKWLPQDRVVRYGLGFDPASDAVFQWRSVHATYYTPMDLRAFPFDRQQLLIQVGSQSNNTPTAGRALRPTYCAFIRGCSRCR